MSNEPDRNDEPRPLFSERAMRPRKGPGAVAWIASASVHAALFVPMLIGGLDGSTRMPEYEVYRVKLFSPPPQALGEPTPAPPKPAVIAPPRPVTPAPKKDAAPKKAVPKPTETAPKETKPAENVTRGANPKPGSTGGENIDIDLEGKDFPDPEYLENVIRQINRYFRWSGAGNLEAHIGFYILRDGTVTRVRVLKRSGNTKFDIAAIEAIETAAKRAGFGVLPKVWPRDTLPVMFRFEPPK